MRRSERKGPRGRLDSEQYEKLRREVLERDGWRCQVCGSMSAVEVHHLSFRSRGGEDCDQNLITVCRRCHNGIHSRRL
jgi:5-methylcytosine-specific restriction endonuclease McrA